MEPYQEHAHRPPLETTGKIEQLTPDMAHAKLLARIEQIADNQRKSVRNVEEQFLKIFNSIDRIYATKSEDDTALTRLRERLEKLEERLRKMRGDKLDQLPDNEKLTHIRLRLEKLEERLRTFDKNIKHLHGALGRNNKQIAILENPGCEERAEPEKIADFLSPGEKDDIERGTMNMPAHEARAIYMVAGKLQTLASRIEQIEKIAAKESTDEGARGVGEPMEAQDAIAHTIAGMDYKLAEILSHLQKFDMERTDERARGGWREEAERQGISEKWMKFFQELQEKHLAEKKDEGRAEARGADTAAEDAETPKYDGKTPIKDIPVEEFWKLVKQRSRQATKKDDGARGYKMSEPPADTEWQAQPQLVVELRFDLYTAFDREANAYLSYCPETGQMDQGDSVSEARVAMGEGAKLLLESTIQRILTDKK